MPDIMGRDDACLDQLGSADPAPFVMEGGATGVLRHPGSGAMIANR